MTCPACHYDTEKYLMQEVFILEHKELFPDTAEMISKRGGAFAEPFIELEPLRKAFSISGNRRLGPRVEDFTDQSMVHIFMCPKCGGLHGETK